MRRAVIVAAARTPIGRARKGSLVPLDASALARVVVPGVLGRVDIPTSDIDDIVLAESMQGGGVIARHTSVSLGMPHVPGQAVNRHCAAGLAAVQTAAAAIRAEEADVAVAGGTESLSNMRPALHPGPGGKPGPWTPPSHPETPEAPAYDMSITVGENTARIAGLTRRDVDEWAAYSHGQAVASQDAGYFTEEIVPVSVPQPDGSEVQFDRDEHPRRGVTVESLAELPLLHPEIDGATVTAGNAAGVNDAAAALVVTSEDYARAHGLQPLATVRSWGVAGVDPADTGLAPVGAIERALDKS